MINAALHAVTNAATFQSPALPQTTSFFPSRPTAAEAAVRSILLPDNSDYYAVAAMALLDAFPDVAALLPEDGRTYDLADFAWPADSVVGATLRPDPRVGPPSILRVPESWPVQFTMEFSRVADGLFSVGRGVTLETCAYQTVGDNLIAVAWPTWSGVVGRLQVSTLPLPEGFRVAITHFPRSVPVAILAGKLTANRHTHALLAASGLVAAYKYADSDEERVALAAAALGRANGAVYP